jgi:hypothetical protein
MKAPIPKKISYIITELPEKFGRCCFDEDYPHVSTKLCLFWGTEFFMDYVESLLMMEPSTTRKTRRGFPFEAIKELQFIVDEHNTRYPQYARIINIWMA